jgi:hypothetical protein
LTKRKEIVTVVETAAEVPVDNDKPAEIVEKAVQIVPEPVPATPEKQP